MASNQTANFGLNQWNAEDKVLREEFNADNAKIDAILSNVGNSNIATGSYIGSGDYGMDTPNKLKFPFLPKLILITAEYGSSSSYYYVAVYGQKNFCSMISTGGNDNNQCTWSDSELSWYSERSADSQANTLGMTYFYIAFG